MVEQSGAALAWSCNASSNGKSEKDGENGRGDWPCRLFPTPEALAGASLGELGLPEDRKRALGALATAVAKANLKLDASVAPLGENETQVVSAACPVNAA